MRGRPELQPHLVVPKTLRLQGRCGRGKKVELADGWIPKSFPGAEPYGNGRSRFENQTEPGHGFVAEQLVVFNPQARRGNGFGRQNLAYVNVRCPFGDEILAKIVAALSVLGSPTVAHQIKTHCSQVPTDWPGVQVGC